MRASSQSLVRSFAAFAIALLLVAAPAAVYAQSPKIFVASYGNDANAGTSAAPKRLFQAAHNAVSAGGHIIVLDTGAYGKLTITKSVVITAPPGVNGFITVSGADNGITINAAATDVVSVRGLIIENSSPSGYPNGIRSNSVGTLTVRDCDIRNFYMGIEFYQPNPGHLQVHGGSLRQNAFGIYLQPTAAVSVDAIVTGCFVENNGTGLLAFGASGTARLTAGDCTISANSTGISAGGAAELISLGNNSFTDNGGDGNFTGTKPRK